MAVPKQKKGRGATNSRRSANSKLAAPARSVCPQCGAPKLPHHVCPADPTRAGLFACSPDSNCEMMGSSSTASMEVCHANYLR